MLTLRQSLALGILQGISELFPISSLGHSIILPALLGWAIDRQANYFLTFLVATHFATAIVLFLFYWHDWVRIIRSTLASIWHRSIADPDARLGWLLIIGTVPAGMLGLLFEKQLEKLFISPSYVASFLALNGALLYIAELLRTRARVVAGIIEDPDQRLAAEVSWWQSAKVGVMQVLALLPGFSRTGSTLAGGLMVGLAHEDALRFSFLLATPIIGAAAALKLPALFVSGGAAAIKGALVGAAGAVIASYFSVRFLTRYFKTRTLTPFAVYCALFGLLSLMFIRR